MLFTTVTDDDNTGRTHLRDVRDLRVKINDTYWPTTVMCLVLTQKLLPVWREISGKFVGRVYIRRICGGKYDKEFYC